MSNAWVLGGQQSDFAVNWKKNQLTLDRMLVDSVRIGAEGVRVNLDNVDAVVVGNFAGERYLDQGLMGGLVAELIPEFYGKPSMRTEAACASGSMAILQAMAQIQAGWSDLVCVIGVEQMRHVPAQDTSAHLGTAIRQGHECQDVAFPWPHLFGQLGKYYQSEHGINQSHLTYLSDLAFRNAARNPNAQTRSWDMCLAKQARDTDINPVIDGMIHRSDCAQITDGLAVLFLASDKYAAQTAMPASRISGFANTTAELALSRKMAHAGEYLFPHVRSAIQRALARAGVSATEELDLFETHDCFTTTAYMAIDHIGLTPPGQNGTAIEEGWLEIGGKLPMNPSGGLIGGGHPVGATGVRQMLDCHRQVQGLADGYQVEGAKRAAMLNLGGSATSAACFVVEAAPLKTS